ncbi:MAG: glutamate synthase [Deltaproteobacteria bacterium]|nr:MAG: glutamate synthase [Deltaproteobacteria bacterium]
MAELVPHPFGRLVTRMFRELKQNNSIFDLSAKRFVRGRADRDTSVTFHGHVASTPLGPAAGPQSQLAQNIVLSFLGGGRIMELKTVQIMDELDLPRPCIDMQTVGYNVEWSQELKLQESLEEYVKASMLIDMLVVSGVLDLAPGFEHVVYDMSVGYDLEGIQNPRVQDFIRGMVDAKDLVERFRAEIPEAYAQYRDLDFRTRLSDTLTLSTFHGCPPDEIERIIEWLLRENRLHCIVKLNPTLLGPARAREILNDVLGHEDQIPDTAFEQDTSWQQAVDFTKRLGETAAELGIGFGVKFSNTLIVENERDFFPESEKVMYLSGKPLHVLAMNLVQKFRQTFGDAYPISFSAGIDKDNFADAVSLGLVPVTVCSDLLRTGGYARMTKYFDSLYKKMDAVSAADVPTFVIKARGHGEAALDGLGLDADVAAACRAALTEGGDLRAAAGDAWERWVRAATLLNTESYVAGLEDDARYASDAIKVPKKVGSVLELFDCLTCDKCIPVCPNDANFTFVLPQVEIPTATLRRGEGGAFVAEAGEPLRIEKKHQIANFADFCNECGNCDVFCPEDGGPYVLKPRFFGSEAEWTKYPTHDGFFVERTGGGDRVLGRFSGKGFELRLEGERATFEGEGFALGFDEGDPAGTAEGDLDGAVDLTYFHIMNWLRKAVLDGDQVNYVNA